MADEQKQPSTIELRQPPGDLAKCRACGDPIRWAKTQRGAKIPINSAAEITTGDASHTVSTAEVHFSTCRHRDKIAKRQKAKTEVEIQLERTITSLRLEIENSAPLRANREASDKARELQGMVRGIINRLKQPGADARLIAEEVATDLQRFNDQGMRPYEGAGRYVGD